MPLFESPPGQLLKSGMRPLDRYGTRQETISKRPEQMYTYLTQGWECLGEGPLFKSVLNKCQGSQTAAKLFKLFPEPSLKSGLLPLDRYGTCQETVSRRLEHIYTHLIQD